MLTYLMYRVYITNSSCTISNDQEYGISAVNISFIFNWFWNTSGICSDRVEEWRNQGETGKKFPQNQENY